MIDKVTCPTKINILMCKYVFIKKPGVNPIKTLVLHRPNLSNEDLVLDLVFFKTKLIL